MAQYTYQARSADGREVKGTLRAPSEKRAKALLVANGLTPILVSGSKVYSNLFNQDVFSKIRTKDLVLFSRQLSAMIRAGVPILESLQALIKQAEKQKLRSLLQGIASDVEGGSSLSSALTKHSAIFSPFFTGVVRTGEVSGLLSESLATLSVYLEQNYVFVRKVRSALLYPAFVLVGVMIVVLLMFLYIVPQLVVLFEEAQVELPLPTRILIFSTDIIQGYWYLLVPITLVVVLIARSYLRTTEGWYAASALLLKLPLLRPMFTKIYLTRLTSILHTLFRSDVPVIESLTIARDSIGNAVFERILDQTQNSVKDGASISEIWENEPYIPTMLTTMVSVGERSGELQNSFAEAQRFFQRDVDEILNTLSVFLEPILVIILGLAVALVVAGVLLPIYNLVLVI